MAENDSNKLAANWLQLQTTATSKAAVTITVPKIHAYIHGFTFASNLLEYILCCCDVESTGTIK